MALSGHITRNPWDIRERSYFSVSTFHEKVKVLLRYAILAPSAYNAQPWRFRIDACGVQILADHARRFPDNDPDDRHLLLALGAATANIRVAAAHVGLDCDVERHPTPLVSIAFRREPRARPALQGLFEAIPKRHTSRSAFGPSPLSAEEVWILKSAPRVGSAGVQFVLDADQRQAVSALVAEGDAVELERADYRHAMSEWARTAVPENAAPALEAADVVALSGAWFLRAYDAAQRLAQADRRLAAAAPALAIVCSGDDSAAAILEAGETLQYFLLAATQLDIRTAFFHQAVLTPDLRCRLRSALALPGSPQLVLRLGRGPAPPHAMPRRPLEESLAL